MTKKRGAPATTTLDDEVPVTELDQKDPEKVKDLEELGQIANSNTRGMLALQRIRAGLLADGKPTDDVEKKIRERQVRSGKLIRQRQKLQAERLAAKEKEIREDLEPTEDKIRKARKFITERLISMLEDVQVARGEANRHGQRRLAAKLRAYEDSATNALHLMNRLANLEQVELEIDER